MRILGLETSSPRGSVALLDGSQLVGSSEHERAAAHAESLLPMVEKLLAECGVARSSLDRLAVGVGPGSFTGLRVGIALAEGLSIGLDRPLFGIGSLRAMARGVPEDLSGPYCALLDAGRNELFAAVYDRTGLERIAPSAVPRSELAALLERSGARCLVGRVSSELELELPVARGPELDLPHARWVATLAGEIDPARANSEALYVRGAGAKPLELFHPSQGNASAECGPR